MAAVRTVERVEAKRQAAGEAHLQVIDLADLDHLDLIAATLG